MSDVKRLQVGELTDEIARRRINLMLGAMGKTVLEWQDEVVQTLALAEQLQASLGNKQDKIIPANSISNATAVITLANIVTLLGDTNAKVN